MITFDFDLERAKAGDPVCMRNGTPVDIIAFISSGFRYPVQGARGYHWTNTGKYRVHDDDDSVYDLRMKYPSSGDWIDWNGGECPVDGDLLVEIVFRYGNSIDQFSNASNFYWLHSGYPGDIIAYKIIEEEKEMEKEYKKFGEMSEEERKDLVYASVVLCRPVESTCNPGNEWNPIVSATWSDTTYYRIAETRPEIDWDHVHHDFNYLAEDDAGSPQLFPYEPKRFCDQWNLAGLGSEVLAITHASYKPGTCDWKDSLIKRPGIDS